MSDVLIKGMKMPIGCDGLGISCPLLQWGLGDVYCRITHRHFDSIEDSFKYAKERPSDCPLVEVPTPHGRLIDEDAFVIEINERIDSAIKWGVNAIADHDEEIKTRAEQAVATFCEASLTAKKMPTIIESEGME